MLHACAIHRIQTDVQKGSGSCWSTRAMRAAAAPTDPTEAKGNEEPKSFSPICVRSASLFRRFHVLAGIVRADSIPSSSLSGLVLPKHNENENTHEMNYYCGLRGSSTISFLKTGERELEPNTSTTSYDTCASLVVCRTVCSLVHGYVRTRPFICALFFSRPPVRR